MRRILHRHRWATLAVTVLLLFATSGMSISRMTCLMGGHTIWSLGMLEDCCPEPGPSEGAMVTAECCMFGQAGGDVLPFVSAQELACGPMVAPLIEVPGTVAILVNDGSELVAATGPPPISGSERIVAHRTFRI